MNIAEFSGIEFNFDEIYEKLAVLVSFEGYWWSSFDVGAKPVISKNRI